MEAPLVTIDTVLRTAMFYRMYASDKFCLFINRVKGMDFEKLDLCEFLKNLKSCDSDKLSEFKGYVNFISFSKYYFVINICKYII